MDKNLTRQDKAEENEVEWHDAKSLTIYGLIPDEEYFGVRMPRDVAASVSGGVLAFCKYTTGGRVRFSTDSPFIALKVGYGPGDIPTVNNNCVSYGFDLYRLEDGKEIFSASARPTSESERQTAEYKMQARNNGEYRFYTLNMPIFTSIKSIMIGIKKGSQFGPGAKYRNQKPVVYYGSSITHGIAAGRPGNTYPAFISEKYNLDYLNLGFAGQAKGEQSMAEYIASLPMSVFVCDYDHNTPNVSHLVQTHFPFYQTIRAKHPDIPYIMVSKPDFFLNPVENGKRRQVIIDSYERAKALGDQNVYFINGETLFEGEFSESCTNDGTHPNDLGFFRMASKIGPVVAAACKIADIEID